MVSDKGKMAPLLSLLVSRSVGTERPNSPPPSTDEEKALREAEQEGWVVHRFVSEFQQLHNALTMVSGQRHNYYCISTSRFPVDLFTALQLLLCIFCVYTGTFVSDQIGM